MLQRVERVLLVSSLYDSFILSEEGQLQETLLGQFADLNLVNIPDLTRVPDGAAALNRIQRTGEFDLVITSIQAGGTDALELTRQLREQGVFIPVVVLAFSGRELADFTATNDTSLLDGVFLWQGDARILLAIIKQIEDRNNVAHDTGVFEVPAIIVVEDNVRFYSSFLPVIYSEIFRHMQQLLSEDLNLTLKMLRMRARPKVLLCETYEEAWRYFSMYEDQVLGVISDIEFTRGGKLDRRAGLDLTARIHEARPDARIVLQPSLPENEALAEQVEASFLLKGSPLLLHQLRTILVERFGFGDFVFRLPDGAEVDRAHNLRSLVEKLSTVPTESVGYHGARNHFSNWMKARTEFSLAARLRARNAEDFDDTENLRDHLLDSIEQHQRQRSLSTVADFDADRLRLGTGIMRIGGGSLGGKARGIAFANRVLQRSEVGERFPDVGVFVPASVVLGTHVFDEFMTHSDLDGFAIASESDPETLKRFLAQPLPERVIEQLRQFLADVRYPLAVRSSSLLEDSLAQAFAGVYRTYMVPNNHPDLEVRLRHLQSAIKRVYASMFTADAKAYVNATSYRVEEEKMAVLIQRLVGDRHGERFYPDFAGVARSYNFYPQPPASAEDGVVAVALGMGRTVVDGEPCVRFSPRHPQNVLEFSSVKDSLANSQREFYALDLSRSFGDGNFAELQRFGLEAAEEDGSLAFTGSTFMPEDNRVVDGISRPGVRLVTFAQTLKHGNFPLPELLNHLLEFSSRGTNSPVEIEFAGTFASGGRRPALAFLQLRPLAMTTESDNVRIGDVEDAALICRSDQVLGNGHVNGIHDAVVVDAHRFDRQKSVDVIQPLASLNAKLQRQKRPYILIGVGRWGSSDRHLGIPVSWNQISGARAIIEAGFEDLRVAPSQGTHFFQNLTSCHVGYFTVNPDAGDGMIDWDWLARQPAVAEDGCVRHLQFDSPISIKMNGRTGEGVVIKPGT